MERKYMKKSIPSQPITKKKKIVRKTTNKKPKQEHISDIPAIIPPAQIKDKKLSVLSINFSLFMKEREFTKFLNFHIQLISFRQWKRHLGRVLLARVANYKQKASKRAKVANSIDANTNVKDSNRMMASINKSSLHTSNQKSRQMKEKVLNPSNVLITSIKSSDTSPITKSPQKFHSDKLELFDIPPKQESNLHTSPKLTLNLSDDFIIAAINPHSNVRNPQPYQSPKSLYGSSPNQNQLVASTSSHSNHSSISSPKLAYPPNPQELVADEFYTEDEFVPKNVKPPNSSIKTKLFVSPKDILPDDLFSSEILEPPIKPISPIKTTPRNRISGSDDLHFVSDETFTDVSRTITPKKPKKSKKLDSSSSDTFYSDDLLADRNIETNKFVDTDEFASEIMIKQTKNPITKKCQKSVEAKSNHVKSEELEFTEKSLFTGSNSDSLATASYKTDSYTSNIEADQNEEEETKGIVNDELSENSAQSKENNKYLADIPSDEFTGSIDDSYPVNDYQTFDSNGPVLNKALTAISNSPAPNNASKSQIKLRNRITKTNISYSDSSDDVEPVKKRSPGNNQRTSANKRNKNESTSSDFDDLHLSSTMEISIETAEKNRKTAEIINNSKYTDSPSKETQTQFDEIPMLSQSSNSPQKYSISSQTETPIVIQKPNEAVHQSRMLDIDSDSSESIDYLLREPITPARPIHKDLSDINDDLGSSF